ncbi:MAG: diaminopimelate epimerase [Planctomycetota bacterium]
MRFIKMHGIGNDYVYVDCVRQPVPADPAALARQVSDRHFGIGGDGLILVCPSEKGDARMRMFNADGSESEMCGNGVRCVAKLVYDHGIARKPRLAIETGRGVLTLDLHIKAGVVNGVTVDMGEPILDGASIPTTLTGTPPTEVPLESPLGVLRATCVSMGNPHAVIFVDAITDALVHQAGPVLERHPAFPRRANIEFVKVLSRSAFQMRVWERGSGETLACGTGACAVAVAGAITHRLDRACEGRLMGGNLQLEWSRETNHVLMTGPATEVFMGEWTG